MADVVAVDVPIPAPEDLLVMRRSRRSTAGNRMEAALAEMALDDSMNDGEDDMDFTNDKDEEDVFDADFESTDEEAAQVDEETGEKAAQEEEKRAKKAARTRLEKATDAAYERNKATFNPQAEASSSKPAKSKRRVSLGVAVNAETGEVISGERPTANRQSQRKHTILNTSLTEKRLKRSEERKAAQVPKKQKLEARTFTQAELIARALDNEEGNIVEHRDYLKLEEEKRKRARVVRPVVDGPRLRWVSRVERAAVPQPQPHPPYAYVGGSSGGYVFPAYQPPPPAASGSQTPYNNPYVPPTPPPARMEKVAKNYVVHDAGGAEKPAWGATMEALFGGHVNWEDVRVYAGKNRPLSRPVQMCPITGRAARYRDPRTGVPYATIGAFETLTRVLNHEYVWSTALGAYVQQERPPESGAS
ncbi:YL1 nuclear protein-domain-containing protein [Mycena sp. CBHHK59/15]|nr:YL1 nuclear protein-domain-containing protein [Mycena sp. CBHHK59/15]